MVKVLMAGQEAMAAKVVGGEERHTCPPLSRGQVEEMMSDTAADTVAMKEEVGMAANQHQQPRGDNHRAGWVYRADLA